MRLELRDIVVHVEILHFVGELCHFVSDVTQMVDTQKRAKVLTSPRYVPGSGGDSDSSSPVTVPAVSGTQLVRK
jgi:hypothetical protein